MKNLDLVLDSLYKSGRIILIQGNEFIYETNLQEKRIRSDNLLDEIKSAFEHKTIQLSDIKRLTLIESNESVTKNRVFKSIAMGIKDSLNIELRIISSLDIFRLTVETKFDYIFAYGSDNDIVKWFKYTRKGEFAGDEFSGHVQEFFEDLQNSDINEIYVADTLLPNLKNTYYKLNLIQFNLDAKIKSRLITYLT